MSKTDGMNNHTSTRATIVAARTASVKTFLYPTRHSPGQLSPITTGSTVTGQPSDYAACIGATATVPTPGVFSLVNSNRMLSRKRFGDITDGTTNTVMIGEKHVQLGMLNNPIQDGLIYSGSETMTYVRRAGAANPIAQNPTVAANHQFGSWHTGVCLFVFGDGSVKGVRNSTPGTTLGYLANIADGQVIPDNY